MSKVIKERHAFRFDQWSGSYDESILNHFIFNASHNMFLRAMAPFLMKSARILDVGCGTGRFAFRLQDANSHIKVHGVDLSKEMIEKAKSKLRADEIHFAMGDVEELPYSSNTFDIITCGSSFHHYPNQGKALFEMRRVLKPGGRLMIIDGCRDGLIGGIVFGIVALIEKDVRHITAQQLKELLLSTGFGEIAQKRFNPIAPLLLTSACARKRATDKGVEP